MASDHGAGRQRANFAYSDAMRMPLCAPLASAVMLACPSGPASIDGASVAPARQELAAPVASTDADLVDFDGRVCLLAS
jgi:hypothetical protein